MPVSIRHIYKGALAGMQYVLSYNAYHNLESIGIDGKTDGALVRYDYKSGNGRLKSVTYANGDKMNATYNSIGQMIAEKWYDSTETLTAYYKYVYDAQGNIVRSIDITAGKEYNYMYENALLTRSAEYDITVENELVTAKTHVASTRYYYDAEGNLTKKRVIHADGSESIIFVTTTDDNTTVSFTAYGRTVTSRSGSDGFGRKTFDELQLGTACVSRRFDYYEGQPTEEHVTNVKVRSSATTNLVRRISFADGRTIEYEYDKEERITKVTDSVDGITEYTYDSLGQLLTETVTRDGVSTVVNSMTYDNYGNILTKNGVTYQYDSVWKDQLVKVGTGDLSDILYDSQGNPTHYFGNTITWEKGRQLQSFNGYTYTYNANGIRTSKTIDGIKHTYTLDGTKILRESWTVNGVSHSIVPLYDNEDAVCGITYNGTPYFFLKNLQGDVIAITNADGETVARYTYDAWGVCTTLNPDGTANDKFLGDLNADGTAVTSDEFICNLNPYRYRGYYYDVEIGCYYLQSRYYNPAIGRFVNADGVMGANTDHSAYDLYTYCSNRVNDCVDSRGSFWKSISNGFKNGVRLILSRTNNVLVGLGFDTAGFGAYWLNMYKDRVGVYHAKFDCWQQYFGYNNFYDFMFDIGTSMKYQKFPFKYGNKEYIFWAWKGNYINLGAGAELGIYTGGEPHWFVDKSLAMEMSMALYYKGKNIIVYDATTWWITGFNPKYLNVYAYQLTVTFRIRFKNTGMYYAFKKRHRTKWFCLDRFKTASFTF